MCNREYLVLKTCRIQLKGVVSDKTREKVEQALEKYHYVENKNARNLAMNRQYTIGYVGFRSRSSAYFSPEVRKGLDRAIREFGDDGFRNLMCTTRCSRWQRWIRC